MKQKVAHGITESVTNLSLRTNKSMKSRKGQDCEELIAKFRKEGRPQDYELFLRKVDSMIEAMVRSKIQEESQRDDLRQEILMSVHKSLPTYDSERSFYNWFYSIVRFRTADFFRKHYRSRETQELSEFITDGSLELDVQYHLQEVKELLGELSDGQRVAITRSKLEGEKIKDIAADLGVTESAVKVNIFRGLKKLRKILSEQW